MKEIEQSSPAWNSSPTERVTIFHSAIAVLRSSLGQYWPFYVLLLTLVMLSPALIFSLLGKIRLEPAHFVNLWFHLSIEGVFFFFILEIVRHRSLSFTARQSLLDFVSWNYIIPVQSLIDSLKQSRGAVGKDEWIAKLTSASNAWAILQRALSDDILNHLPGDGALPLWILGNRAALDPQRCAQLLGSFSAGTLKPREFDDLLDRLQRLLAAAEKLCRERSLV